MSEKACPPYPSRPQTLRDDERVDPPSYPPRYRPDDPSDPICCSFGRPPLAELDQLRLAAQSPPLGLLRHSRPCS